MDLTNRPLLERALLLKANSGLTLASLTLAAGLATAADVNLTARFLPNANKPDMNVFENTTPNSGYCADRPWSCPGNRFSVLIPNRTAPYPLRVGMPVGFRVPWSWRELTVTHTNGASQQVKVRIVGMGAWYRLSHSINAIGAGAGNHTELWEDNAFVYPPAGCTNGGVGSFLPNAFRFFWLFNSNNECKKVSKFDVTPGLSVTDINFMYELQTPNPLDMNMGIYTGSITYSLGPNSDFKAGEGDANDPVIRLNFTLSVQHTLRVQFPANANLVALQPKEGWQQWLYNGANYRPTKLLANQPYQQWASTKFKMQLQCQYRIGNDCGIQNDAGNSNVPVKTLVTLPSGIRDNSNNPVLRRLLSNTVPEFFTSTRYTNDERATLHFEVENQDVAKMVDSGGGRYKGDVTVIWDSDV